MRTITPRAIPMSLAVAIALGAGAGYRTERAHAQAPAASPSSSSNTIDPALLAGLHWRSIGPARGGRSQAVAGSASRPLEYYFGATGGGLWKTTDGGLTWRAAAARTAPAT